MEIRITNNQILKILLIISWIIFIGVCIEAGSFLFNILYTMVLNPGNSSYLHLSDLYAYDHGHFLVVLIFMSIVAIMRALIFYLIVKILQDKKLDMSQPFNKEMGRFILNVAYLALGIGIFSHWGAKYTEWLKTLGITMPDIQFLRLDGADVWLFMSITLFVIQKIFKKGIEIQTENELTI